VAAMVDELGQAGRRTGSVNAIRKEGRRLIGDNFDGAGFLAGLTMQGHKAAGRRVLLVGAGGAGRAVAHALADAGVSSITLNDRDPERARELAASLRHEHATLRVEDGPPRIVDHDMVVNCAPPTIEP